MLSFVAAVTVGPTGSENVFPNKIGGFPGFRHGIIQMTQGGSQVVKSQLFHQRADAALVKPCFVAAAVGVLKKVHVPRVGGSVGGLEPSGGLHAGNVLFRELFLSALATEPFHGLVVRQWFHLRALRTGQRKDA